MRGKQQQVCCYWGVKSVGKGGSLEVFSSKSSRKPKTCFAFARVFIPRHTTLWHCHPPRSFCGIMGSATSSGTWREIFLTKNVRYFSQNTFSCGERDCMQSPSSFSADFRRSVGSFYWESSHAGPLRCWSIFWVYQRCRLPCLQVLLVPGPCHTQACPSLLPSPDLAWGCSWVWKCVTSQHPIINIPSVVRIRPSATDAFSNLRNI